MRAVIQFICKYKSTASFQYLLAIIFGIIYGIILNAAGAGTVVTTVITLPGPMFLRALQCAVLPMMFFNITVSVATIHYDGKTSTLGKRFVSLFMTTALLAVINGVCIANLFGSIIDSSNAHDDDQGPEVGLQCPEGMGKVTVSTGGRLICLQAGQLARFNVTDSQQELELIDLDKVLVNDASESMTLFDQVVGSLHSIFPDNAMESFAIPNVISVLAIAVMMGGAIVYLKEGEGDSPQPPVQDHDTPRRGEGGGIELTAVSSLSLSLSQSTKKRSNSSGAALRVAASTEETPRPAPVAVTLPAEKSKAEQKLDLKRTGHVLLQFFTEMSQLSNTIVSWIISTAPLCMGFLIARSLAEAGSLLGLLHTVGIYVTACLTGMLIHVIVVLPAMLYYFTGLNPYSHIYSCRKAVLVAFSTSSSVATLPVTIQCCVKTQRVTPVIADVILPMGTNVVKDGMAVALSCGIMFLAHADNMSARLTAGVWFITSVSTYLGSMAAPPIQSSGLVTIISVWQAGFPHHDVPSAISYLQAIDFIADRFITATNVITNIVIVTILQFMMDREKLRNEEKKGSIV